jgi:hypothetical protein
MGGEVEEWYQNKLSKVMSEVESLHSYIEGESRRTGMKEEAELDEEIGVHRIGVTVSDPSHPMASKRKETHQKFVRVTNKDPKLAEKVGRNHFIGKGFKVHDSWHAGMHKEEVELEESHFKLGDTVKCKASGMSGKVVKLDKEHGADDDKYYTVKRQDGKEMKYAPNELSLMKEESLEERNKENATKRKMMDASRGARFKAQGNYTPDPEPEHKTAQAHNKAVGRAIRQMSKEEVELDELNKSTLASYAKKATHDARIQQSIGKDFEADRSRKPGMKAAAKELADKYKSKSRKREAGVGKAIDRLAKEEVELDEKMNLATAKMGDVIKDFQTSDAPQFAGKSKEKRREMAIAAKLEADRGTKKEETEMLSYKEFMMMLEYEPKGGVYRHSGTYGSEYAKKEREKDEQGFDAKDDNQSQKRGRGRPAGAKSGARGPRIK